MSAPAEFDPFPDHAVTQSCFDEATLYTSPTSLKDLTSEKVMKQLKN